ncbi:Hypothetical protein SRAE_1000047100 [Strongyloides ratti]|uniref:OCIA domain-containing protein n=1 Tax=Strongyloides ratti TaxID=34506 RepID=A0A090L2A0_STRRB|nr:Hypothetical protein SRAE_1000047100 [Strongyloides ratti]CEF62197.1 Hypothetical protein SRAE_1000047100 [Strongyloides ratti]
MDFNNVPAKNYDNNVVSKDGITREEVSWLFQKLSPNDRVEVSKELASCLSRTFYKNGLPIVGFLCSTLYLCRLKLPNSAIGKAKPLPLYFIAIFSAMNIGGMINSNKCSEAMKPKLINLFEKYKREEDINATKNEYPKIREGNQQHIFKDYDLFQENSDMFKQTEGDNIYLDQFSNKENTSKSQQKISTYYYDSFPSGYISGTPNKSQDENLES